MFRLTPCSTATRLRTGLMRRAPPVRACELRRASTSRAVRARRPGASTSTNGTLVAVRFLSRVRSRDRDAAVDALGAGRQAVRVEQLGDLRAQLRALGERSAASSPSADGLAVAVAAVSGRRLDRVADRVAEVEHLPAARRRARRRRRSRACSARSRRSRRRRSAGLPAIRSHSAAPGDQRGLDHLSVPSGELRRRQRRERRRGRRAPPAGWW